MTDDQNNKSKNDAMTMEDDSSPLPTGLLPWCDDYRLFPGQALTLAICPRELLVGEKGRERIEAAMEGIGRPFIESLDGFGLAPSGNHCYDMNLLMVAASEGCVDILKYWIEECGISPDATRSSALWSPLIFAIAHQKRGAADYLKRVTEIGLTEAAALAMADVVPKLIKEYNALPEYEKWYGLKGEEIALIFSGLSGDEEWVLSLAEGCSDINVGHDLPTGGLLGHSIRSGNVDLVKKLVQEMGVRIDSPHNICPLAFRAIYSVPMLKYLLEELKVCPVDALDEEGYSLVEVALLNRRADAVKYLLEKKPASEWAYLAKNTLVGSSLGKWNSHETNQSLLPAINKGNVQDILRNSLRQANLPMARYCVEQKGGNLGVKPRGNMTTLLEEAITSGSFETVDYVLQNAPEHVISFVHSNGYNSVVAAARTGRDIFDAVSKKFPGRLHETVWDGMTLLMVAASEKSGAVVDYLLREDFYDAECRGKVLDANAKCQNGRTALWYAVRSGVAETVERILRRKDWLNLRELRDEARVNALFRLACTKPRFVDILACFARHRLTYTGGATEGSESASLAMAATENGVLLGVADVGFQLRHLQDMDESVGLSVPAELLLCSSLSNAPEWAINQGKLSRFVKDCFLGDSTLAWEDEGGSLKFRTAYELALTTCDHKVVELFQSHPCFAKAEFQDTAGQIVLLALKGKDNKGHPSVTARRNRFVSWLFSAAPCPADVSGKGPTAFAVLELLIKAGLEIEAVKDKGSGGSHLSSRCTPDQLSSLARLSAEFCQLSNVKILAKALQEKGVVLSQCRNDKGRTLISAALGDCFVTDYAKSCRLPLVQWLVASGFDLSATNNDGETALMEAASTGDVRVFDWILKELGPGSMEARDNKDSNLVKHAVKGGHINILQRCVEAVGTNSCSSHGESALHCAVASGKVHVARYLLEVAGIDINSRDATNRAVSDYLLFTKETAIEDYLEVHGLKAEPNHISHMHTVQAWLKQIGDATGKNITLNDSGICAFTYEDHTIVIEVPQTVQSFFVYAILEGDKFDIQEDSRKMLLRTFEPGEWSLFCSSIERGNEANAVLSYSMRVAECTAADFRQLLENFIDYVLAVAKQLTIVAAQRYLKTKILSLPSANFNDGQTKTFSGVLSLLESCLVEPRKKKVMSALDLASFRESLQRQMDEINRAIGRDIRVGDGGTCGFTYEHLTVVLEPSTSPRLMNITVTLWSKARHGPITDELRKRALGFNYLQQDTRGGMIVEIGAARSEELLFLYEDSVDLPPSDFRNILENLIDTAMSLHSQLRAAAVQPNTGATDIELEIRTKKGAILRGLLVGDFGILDRIIEETPEASVCDRLEQLALLVLETKVMELWAPFFAIMMLKSEASSKVEMANLRDLIRKRVFEKDMFDDEILLALMVGDSDLRILGSIFTAVALFQTGKAAATAQRVLDLTIKSGHVTETTMTPIYLEKWSNYASNVISLISSAANVQEVIKCLDWIFSRTKPGDLDDKKNVRTLLHLASAFGEVELVQFLLRRLPHLTVDEETLVWASRQGHLGLVKFVLESDSSLPRDKSILAAAAADSIPIQKALGVGPKEEGKEDQADVGSQEEAGSGGQDGDAMEVASVSSASSMGSRTSASSRSSSEGEDHFKKNLRKATADAIQRGKVDTLVCLLSDPRQADAALGKLLEAASESCESQKVIEAIISSPQARSQAYTASIPWQAQVAAKRTLVLPVLQVAKKLCLPPEIGSLIYSFAELKCQPSPLIHSENDLKERKYLSQLERDLGLDKGVITSLERTDGSTTFDFDNVGSLNLDIPERVCRLVKRIEFEKDEFRVTPADLLALSRILPGCFLSSGNSEKGMFLRCVMRFPSECDGGGEGIRYHDLRKLIVSFRSMGKVVESVLKHARKFKVLASVSSLGAFIPQVLQIAKARSTVRTTTQWGRTFGETRFTTPPLVLMSTPLEDQTTDRSALLAANSAIASSLDDGSFCFVDEHGVAQAGIYFSPLEAAKDHKVALLARVSSSG